MQHAFLKIKSYISYVKIFKYVLYQIVTHTKIYQNTRTIERNKSYKPITTRGVSHWRLPFIYIKNHSMAKEELMETQVFQHAKI
jgi:hypothetical protein